MSRYTVTVVDDGGLVTAAATCSLSGEPVAERSARTAEDAIRLVTLAAERWVEGQTRRVPMTEAEACALEDAALDRFKAMFLGHR